MRTSRRVPYLPSFCTILLHFIEAPSNPVTKLMIILIISTASIVYLLLSLSSVSILPHLKHDFTAFFAFVLVKVCTLFVEYNFSTASIFSMCWIHFVCLTATFINCQRLRGFLSVSIS